MLIKTVKKTVRAVVLVMTNLCLLFYAELACADRATELEKMLPMYQLAMQHPWSKIIVDFPLKKDVTHPAVILLRQRLCQTKDLLACADSAKNQLFDAPVEKAVRIFQERHNLNPDGIVGDATLKALNVSPAQRLSQININVARWKALLSDTRDQYVWVNIPDYRLRLVKNHAVITTFPVIVGKISRKTPEIRSNIDRIVINPYWYVPPTILRKDILPKVMRDTDYLQTLNIKVFSVKRPSQALNPANINWLSVKENPSQYVFRQEPGDDNALGRIKFEFANSHLIYLHDTPATALFNQNNRSFSSGCIRVKDPLSFLAYLMDWDSVLRQEKVQMETALASGKTTVFKLSTPVPIRITYITAWVDKSGILHFWDDIYDKDQQLIIQQNRQQNDLPQPV